MTGENVAAIHGWGCTPTGEPPSGAINNNGQSTKLCLPVHLARGWQRTTLFLILAVLMLIVFTNIGLTLWIIATLRLSMDSVGPIKIIKGGIQLQGQALVDEHLIASTITSRIGQPITIHSYRNFTVLVSEPDKKEYASIFLKRDALDCAGREFQVTDGRGRSVFRAARDEVVVSADSFTVEGGGGVNVRDAVQTPLVRAPPGSDLILESQTRSLDIRAPQSVTLESRAGNIDITSHKDIKLESIVGAVKIDAPNIIISNLKQAMVTDKPSNNKNTQSRVYQICACATGKLFLTAPEGFCAAHSDDVDLCR